MHGLPTTAAARWHRPMASGAGSAPVRVTGRRREAGSVAHQRAGSVAPQGGNWPNGATTTMGRRPAIFVIAGSARHARSTLRPGTGQLGPAQPTSGIYSGEAYHERDIGRCHHHHAAEVARRTGGADLELERTGWRHELRHHARRGESAVVRIDRSRCPVAAIGRHLHHRRHHAGMG